jgi:hypothetical protein
VGHANSQAAVTVTAAAVVTAKATTGVTITTAAVTDTATIVAEWATTKESLKKGFT